MRQRNSRRNGRKNGGLVTDMVKGAIAGATGVWVMDGITWDMCPSEDPEAFEQEKEARIEGTYDVTDSVLDALDQVA